MKRYLILIVCLIFWGGMKGQNLVPNPSFEIYDTCPSGVGDNLTDEVRRAIGWSSFRNSPDYFNACADSASYVSVPNNGFGYQPAYDGNAYCGFQTFFTTNYREIIGCQLSSPLIIGTKYYVSFKLARAYKALPFGVGGASNKIGARFSTISYNEFTNPTLINNFAHVYTDSIITDTLNWVNIQGSIIADSSYQYLGIGNFFDDNHTDTIQGRCYYWVDMVCVSTDSLTCIGSGEGIPESNNNPPNNIFPNPAFSTITIKGKGITTYIISNTLGQVIKEGKLNGDETTIAVSALPNGIYILALDGRSFYKVSVMH